MASPACNVKDGGGAYSPTTSGINATTGNTISIQLASVAGVNTWSIACVYTDELSNAVTVTSALVIDNLNKIATFTAPAAGRAYIFQSRINGGIDANGAVQPTLTTTFGIYTLAASGNRVVAANETVESSSTFGWVSSVNPALRAAGGGGSVTVTPLGTAPLVVVKDVAAGSVRHRTIRVAGNISGQVDPSGYAGEIWIRPSPPGHLNPFDFGAVADGTTDDAPAFQAMLASIPLSTGVLAGNRYRILVPPGNYRFASQVIVDRKVMIEGVVAGGGVTITCDNYSSGFVLAGFGWGTGGDAGGVVIRNIHFVGGPNHLVTPKWAPGTAYTGGASSPSRILPANLGFPETDQPHSYEWHYRCMKSGTSAAASASPANIATPKQWSAGLVLVVGDVVKQGGLSAGTVPGRYDVLFRVTTAGTTGGTIPATFTTANDGDTGIADGTAVYAAFKTNEPDWYKTRFMDISTPWTAGEVIGGAAIRHASFATNRWDVFFVAETVVDATDPTGGSEPAAFATCKVGDTIVDNVKITWRAWATGAEVKPTARANTTAYVVGNKISASTGTRWVCVTAGTSAGAEPAAMTTGVGQFATVTDGTAVFRYYYTGGSMILDNGVVWSARVASAIVGATPCTTESVSAFHFTNAGQHFQCDLGSVPSLDCSGSYIVRAVSTACGVGLSFHGGDCNTCTIISPKITGQWEASPYPAGELGIVDASFLGNRFYSPWVQSLRGPGFQVGTAFSSAPSSTGALFGGYFEACGDLDVQSFDYQISGLTGSGSVPCYGLPERRGFTKRSSFYGAPAQGDESNCSGWGTLSTDNQACQFGLSDYRRSDPNGGYMAWMYNRTLTGWWNHEYYATIGSSTLMESTAASAEGYGYLGFQNGFFFGASDGARFYLYPTKAASQDGRMYSGKRLIGYIRYRRENIAPGGYAADICTADGYDGVTWFSHSFNTRTPSGVYKAAGDTVIPTSLANLGCWEFIGGGGTSSVEPTWPATGGLTAGDRFTDGQSNVWEFRGLQPTWSPAWQIGNGPSVTPGAFAIDWSTATVFTKTLSAGANTFTFANAKDGQTITVIVTGAASTLTWPAVKWKAGAAPTQTASGTDLYSFVKAGANIYGTVTQAMA